MNRSIWIALFVARTLCEILFASSRLVPFVAYPGLTPWAVFFRRFG